MIPNPEIPVVEPFFNKSFIKFMSEFRSNEECLRYCYSLKFAKGFRCRKCGCKDSYKGQKPYTQVCRNCRFIESATSGTLFHRLKIPMRTAFMIMYDLIVMPKGISTKSAALKYGISKNASWLFIRKAKESMKSTSKLDGKVYVDEFVIGGYEEGKTGRTKDSKKIKAIMAVEVTPTNKIKRLYVLKIKDYYSNELRRIFDKHISKTSKIYTDGLRSYCPIKNHGYDITQDKSICKDSPVNLMIQQIKSWVRGVHHSISHYHCESYFNEFSFRINRSQSKETIFHSLLNKMISHRNMSRLQLSDVTCRDREAFVQRVMYYENWNIKYQIRYGKVKLVA